MPAPSQIELTGASRYSRGRIDFLDVAVAAEAFHRLGDRRGRALAHPVLGDRGGEAGKAALGRVLGASIEGARQTQHQRGRGLDLESEIGEHVAHQRLVDQSALEGRAMLGVVQRLGERLTHQGGRADRGVEPGVVHHLDDGAHAVALLADQPGERARVLDLRRGVGAVAELVLEALDQDGVARAVGAPARHQEAGQAAGACARVRKPSEIGAEQNHLWPISS